MGFRLLGIKNAAFIRLPRQSRWAFIASRYYFRIDIFFFRHSLNGPIESALILIAPWAQWTVNSVVLQLLLLYDVNYEETHDLDRIPGVFSDDRGVQAGRGLADSRSCA